MKLTAPPLANLYELERRIAVDVMDLPAVEFNDRTKCPYCDQVGRMTIGRIWCCNCESWYYHPYKNYRDSMDDAMEVVEKMRERGWTVLTQGEPTGDWMVTFSKLRDDACEMLTGEALAPRLAEAICNASLDAFSQQVR